MKTYSKNCKTRKPDGIKKKKTQKKAYGGMTGSAKPMKKAMGGAMDMGESMYQGMKQDAANKMTMMAKGGNLKMVEKDGKKVPFYAADGKGKMMYGGMAKKKA